MTSDINHLIPLDAKQKNLAKNAINIALSADDFELMKSSVMEAARTRGIAQLAREAGISRVGVYKALEPGSSPSFQTICKIMGALGLRFEAIINE